MFLRVATVAAFGIALCSCITAEQQASVAEPPKPITCHAGPDCDAKWSRATSWVSEHSKYNVETSSDSVIQTSGPSTFETDPSPGYKIAKIAMGPGEYAIAFTGGCDSILPCTPALSAAHADFTQSITAVEPAPQSRPEKKQKKTKISQFSR
jgi:hypothetical protein